MLYGVSFLRVVKLADGTHLRWRVANTVKNTDIGIESVSGYRVYWSSDGVDFFKLGDCPKTVNDQFLSALAYSTGTGPSFFKVSAVASDDGTEYYPSQTNKPYSPAVFFSLDFMPGAEITKYPPWFMALPQSEQQELLTKKWFTNWLDTTTSLWPNITKVADDNPTIENDILWREDGDMLFHADEEGRRPDEIFISGLTPPEPMGSMALRPGSHVGVLESFSRLFDWLTVFAGCDSTKIHYSDFDERYIYITNAPGGICVDDTLASSPGHSESESEIAFPGGVKPKYIVAVFVFKDNEFYDSDDNRYIPLRFDYNQTHGYNKPNDDYVNIITSRVDANEFQIKMEGESEWFTLNEPLCTVRKGKYTVKSKISHERYYANIKLINDVNNGVFQLDTDEFSIDNTIVLSGHDYDYSRRS